MRKSAFLTTLVLATSLFWLAACSNNNQGQSSVAETAYSRITKTGTLRCGYINYAPLLNKDPNTGAITGIGADIMEKIAKTMNVKIIWAEETSWATYIQGLESNRFDALCTLDFFLPAYAGKLEAPKPVFYTSIGAYKRANDQKMKEGFKSFNDPAIKISALDGSLSMHIQQEDYPKATVLSMPHNTDYTFLLENVVSSKADIAFVENSIANEYLKANPGKLVNIAQETPIRIYPYFVPIRAGETHLKTTIDSILEVMIENGDIEKILSKYEDGVQNFHRVKKGYE